MIDRPGRTAKCLTVSACVALACVALACVAPARVARAQPPANAPLPRGPARQPVRCAGQPISDVVVLTQPPYMHALLGRVAFVERAVRKLHATSREELIVRFLLIGPGDRCDELRRAESERILRAQPFLVDARVTPYDDGHGGVLLEVETRDEFSTILDASAKGFPPVMRNVRIGEANLAGAGLYTTAEWRNGGRGYRDGYSARLRDYQFMGRPFQLTLLGRIKDVGGEWDSELTHPFYTDLQRVAWRVAAGGVSNVVSLKRPDFDDNVMFFRRGYGALGGVARIGSPGRLSLFGASLSAERAHTEDRVRILSDSGEALDNGPPLGFAPHDRYRDQHVVRVNWLWGIRNVRFLGATGFDALTGRQDVRRGFQLGTVVGRGLGSLGSRDDDIFTSLDAYVGAGTSRAFLGMETLAEGRHDFDAERWDGVVVSGRAATYLAPAPQWRTVLSAEYSGTWRPRVPVQLALGAIDGGVRGFFNSSAAGARRIVFRGEQRRVLGTPFGLGDLGVALFADAGRTIAGNAPYGVTTDMQASVGASLLGAFPPRSRRMWRIDFAVPVTHTPGSRFQILLSNRDLTRVFWREPRDVQPAREQAAPASLFNWPER